MVMMMKPKLICFDIDGTLDCQENDNEQYLKGIVPTEVLLTLQNQGINIALVSPSPYGPEAFKNDKHWFQRNGSNDYRWENVLDAMNAFAVSRDETMYVDDLEANRNQLLKEGVESVSPEGFMFIVEKGTLLS
jgi:FMN phosphatase YigB (HAD superfamily)